jgi:transglutaminase/protease-like cytokinesis protein 3
MEIKKIKISFDMIGMECLIATDDYQNELDKMKLHVSHECEIKEIPDNKKRSYQQLKTYWKLCQIVSDNINDKNWNTKEKVNEQCKIACRLYDCFVYYENKKTGEQTLNIRTSSISYAKLAHLEACNYFTEAFKVMADKLGITVEQLLSEGK